MAPPSETGFFADPKMWLAVGSIVVSAIAALNSLQSRRIAARALALNEAQEQRRQPRLRVSLVDGYRRVFPGKQLFGFLLSVTNPTDANNSIATAELKVTYFITDNVKGTCRLLHNADIAQVADVNKPKPNVFTIPMRLEAHHTATGWLFFSLEDSIFKGRSIDAHKILLEDSNGTWTTTEAIAVRELINEDPAN